MSEVKQFQVIISRMYPLSIITQERNEEAKKLDAQIEIGQVHKYYKQRNLIQVWLGQRGKVFISF